MVCYQSSLFSGTSFFRQWYFTSSERSTNEIESVFLSRVEGRGFHVEGEGTKSRVEGNIFFPNFFFLEKVIIDAINVIKTTKKNLTSSSCWVGWWNREKLRDIHKENVMLFLLLFN